jgi:hypothetical protein
VFTFGVLGAVGVLAGLVVLSALAGVVSLVFWVVLLPFKLLGLVFRGIAFLLFLPFLLLFGGGIVLLVGLPILLTLLVIAAPAVLFALAIVWLAKKTMHRAAA